MSRQGIDRALLQKYLNGELDARAMHRLERQAQDDPFLMDALEGYQSTAADQGANLDELTERLRKRVAEKRTRVIPIPIIGIAASVLIICSAGVWWLYRGSEPVKQLAKNETKQPETQHIAADTVADKKPPAQYAENPPAGSSAKVPPHRSATQPLVATAKNNTSAASEAPIVGGKELTLPVVAADTKVASPLDKDQNADTTPLNEVIVMNYKSSKKADTSRLALHEVRKRAGRDTAPAQRLIADVPGVKVYASRPNYDLNRAVEQGSLGAGITDKIIRNNMIQGKVVDQSNGLPIQGASVKVSGTNQATKTDASGFFRIQADTSHAKLEVTTRGYQARQVNTATNTRDSVKTIVLAPDQSDALSESIVTGFTSKPKDADEVYIAAHPQTGWSAFKKYLKINAVSPDKAVGIVKVRFSVDKFGSVSNIKVIKGLSEAANKKAVSIVKDGPDWVGNSNKQPETITLRIRFGK